MSRLERSHFVALAIALVVVLGFTLAGGTQALGAHPWWAGKVGYIGVGIGAVVWLVGSVVRLGGRWLVLAASGALGAAGLAVWLGKARFAETYADDVLAGRFWYFGWIAAMAAACVLIAVLIEAARRPRP
jgi:hypothetical protein